MKFIMTGHRGLIGSYLLQSLQERGDEAVGLIDSRDGSDIRDIEKLHTVNTANLMIHLASFCKINKIIQDPELSISHNVLGTSTVMEFCRRRKIPKIVFTSSSRVLSPEKNPYTAGKIFGEELVKGYSDCYGIDFVILRLPVIGNITKELNTARTARTISSLLLSGVSITRAVEITEDVVQNIYYKRVLSKARLAVEKGSPFSEVFEANANLYPIMMSEMIQVGEETGKLSDMLLQIALFYEEEIENKTKNLSTIIEPILMIVIGAGVGFFAISMISPLYSILGSIG